VGSELPAGAALFERLLKVAPLERDAWVDALLGLDSLPPDMPGLPPGAVPYLPCEVDAILAMVRELPLEPEDEVVDLGSGLGRVVFLAHLLSGAKAHGIELQPHLVQTAEARRVELGLEGVSFACANAEEAELDGSVFFLYAPFNGDILDRVMARLEEVARRRPIAVCTVGVELGSVSWLAPRRTSDVALSIYESR
jgi:SAM-dependent methyltransferase